MQLKHFWVAGLKPWTQEINHTAENFFFHFLAVCAGVWKLKANYTLF